MTKELDRFSESFPETIGLQSYTILIQQLKWKLPLCSNKNSGIIFVTNIRIIKQPNSVKIVKLTQIKQNTKNKGLGGKYFANFY